MAATSPTRAGLEGAGQGPSAVYTGNRGCQVAHNPSSAAEHFLRLGSAAQRSATQSHSWRARSTQAEGFLQPR